MSIGRHTSGGVTQDDVFIWATCFAIAEQKKLYIPFLNYQTNNA